MTSPSVSYKSVTVNVTDSSNNVLRTHTFHVESNCSIAEALLGNGSLTEAQCDKYQEMARGGKDSNILEACDLGGEEKLELAKHKGYNKYYDLSLSEDKKYMIITIKEATIYPRLGVIKDDFGVGNRYFVEKKDTYSPTYNSDNAEVLGQRHEVGEDGTKDYDYDAIRLEPGDTLKIPVDKITIGSPTGDVLKFIKGFTHFFDL